MARLTVSITVAASLIGGVPGCTTHCTRIETVVGDDGSVDRAFLQPKDRTPDSARSPGDWRTVTSLPRQQAEHFAGTIRHLKHRPRENVDDYAAAWGHFATVADIPAHYVRTGGTEASPESRLVPKLQIIDRGLLQEFVWTEVLTGNIEFHDFRDARADLFRFVSSLYEYMLSRALSDDYDVTRLVRWIRTDGRDWFYDVTDELYVSGLPLTPEEEARFSAAVLKISRHRSFGPPDLTEDDLLDDSGSFDIDRVLPIVLRHYVRRLDGQPLSDSEVSGISRLFFLNFDTGDELQQKLEAAKLEAIQKYPGGEDAVEHLQEELLARMFGVHGTGVLEPEDIICELTVPGRIIETTGTVLGDSSVRWHFRAARAWPRGYVMACRSLLDRTSAVPELAAAGRRPDRRTLLRLRHLAGQDEVLTACLIRCYEQRSLAPLRQLVRDEGEGSLAVEAISLLERAGDTPAGASP